MEFFLIGSYEQQKLVDCEAVRKKLQHFSVIKNTQQQQRFARKKICIVNIVEKRRKAVGTVFENLNYCFIKS